MFDSRSTRLWLTCFAAAAACGWGCAVSESLDLPDAASSGAGGESVGVSTGGTSGNAPALGAGGATGAAGAQGVAGASGLAGETGAAGSLGAGGTNAAGGSGGSSGVGGRAGNAGSGGRAGASGGRGGHGGTGGASVGGKGGSGGQASSPDASTAPTFTEIYKTIIIVYCSGSSCHDPGTSGGLGFATQASAFAALSHQVRPGDGVDSDLYVTLDTGVMPKGKPKLSAANIALIREWIDAGALND
jgi:hypothetical protein